ncbi:inositol monophosphatase [Brachyspira hyodysenteriae]|uniref:Inositol-1-monophosphatase n=2 Tax=Brachyspira hyodysenteriae TaxID=159 RepID=A0A3B6V838_BRAHW|nr:inositol monophosphatase family protein [Brachyspira hyodysenteriae]ACN82702.1 inositol-1-monophosphatase [Brachyspira hyodysenteriae WA1]ANN62670.1 inositol monophosphatase [Brachyspira hyodysenteriae ATCC 27164]KLI13989.1 inositol-1-monophosphatase [Brachyspira hyodysenteriae]KLI16481.1 inositol-1-monophosphatase [Brachyspira hyodysenteriae]KLI23605.1 inositol-1-monophosphatase [Brachyspira hyodysenteriae]
MLNDIIEMLTNGFSRKNKNSNSSEYNTILDEIKDLPKSKLNKCLKDAEKIAIKAGKYSLKYFGCPKKVSKKGKADLFTEVDLKNEKKIKEYLLKCYPKFGFYGEESKDNTSKKFTWIVDPIDGTSNFIHGYPFYCISIGLAYKGIPILGVVYAPLTDTVYKAHIKSKAYKNNKVIKVSSSNKLVESIIITGFYYNANVDDDFLHDRMVDFANMVKSTLALRRDGSAALDICMVAEGVADGFFEYGLSPWDICAGTIILKQAGGMVTDINMGEYDIFSKEQYIASNKKIHKEMVKVLE